MGVPPDAQFASYRHTSAKTPLSPVLTSLFHRKLDQLSKIQAVPTPRFTRDRCGSGNQNGVLFRTLQHADRLLELASAEFATRPRTGVRGVAADVWQAEAQQAEARFLARNRPASGSWRAGTRLRRMPPLPAAVFRPSPPPRAAAAADDAESLERALAQELGYDAPAQPSAEPEQEPEPGPEPEPDDEQEDGEQEQQIDAEAEAEADAEVAAATVSVQHAAALELRCVVRTAVVRDRVDAAPTGDAEEAMGHCEEGDVVVLDPSSDGDETAADVRRVAAGPFAGGWVCMVTDAGSPRFAPVGSDDDEGNPKAADAAAPDAASAPDAAEEQEQEQDPDDAEEHPNDHRLHGDWLTTTQRAHHSTHAGADFLSPSPQSETTTDEVSSSQTPVPPVPYEVKPSPDQLAAELAARLPWGDHKALSATTRRGADGGLYALHGWLATPPAASRRRSSRPTPRPSTSTLAERIEALERTARCRAFWGTLGEGGDRIKTGAPTPPPGTPRSGWPPFRRPVAGPAVQLT